MASDKPGWPHVRCKEGEYMPLSLGWVGKGFVLATIAAIGTVSVTAYRLEAGEEADETLEQKVEQVEGNVKTLGENQRKMDEAQRINAAQTGLTVRQLNKLLELEGVTERILAPPVEPSELEELE